MSKKKKNWIKLIANPGAGQATNTTERLDQVTSCLMGFGFQVDVALAKPKEAATPLARKAAKQGYPIVVVYGGDGTIEAVARGLVGTKARLGIIPSGTENNVARCLGIPEDLEAACALIKEKPKRRIDVGVIKTRKKKKFTFIEVAALGLTAALYPEGKDLKQDLSRANLSSLLTVAKTFIDYPTPTIRLVIDGESRIKVDSMLAVVSNTPAFGYSFLIAPNASVEDGKLDITLYPNFSKPELIAYFAKVAGGDFAEDKRIQRYRASKIKIKSKPDVELMSDGVMLGKGTLKIKVLPKELKIIARPGAGLSISPELVAEKLPVPLSPSPDEETERQIKQGEQKTQQVAEQVKESQLESKNGIVGPS